MKFNQGSFKWLLFCPGFLSVSVHTRYNPWNIFEILSGHCIMKARFEAESKYRRYYDPFLQLAFVPKTFLNYLHAPLPLCLQSLTFTSARLLTHLLTPALEEAVCLTWAVTEVASKLIWCQSELKHSQRPCDLLWHAPVTCYAPKWVFFVVLKMDVPSAACTAPFFFKSRWWADDQITRENPPKICRYHQDLKRSFNQVQRTRNMPSMLHFYQTLVSQSSFSLFCLSHPFLHDRNLILTRGTKVLMAVAEASLQVWIGFDHAAPSFSDRLLSPVCTKKVCLRHTHWKLLTSCVKIWYHKTWALLITLSRWFFLWILHPRTWISGLSLN